MKIKEVAQKTGLTEKTIRFYEEKGLINPDKTDINGRAFRDYTAEDVDDLLMIATLRKLDFSISDIYIMMHEPDQIGMILQAYKEKTQADLRLKTAAADVLAKFDKDDKAIKGWHDFLPQIYSAFADIAKDKELPESDTEFMFYKLDGLTKKGLEREVEKYHKKLAEKDMKKIRNRLVSTIFLFALTVVAMTLCMVLLMKNIYGLEYISFLEPNPTTKPKLVIFFVLAIGALAYYFIRVIVEEKKNGGRLGALGIKAFRKAALIINLILILTITFSAYNLKVLDDLRQKAAAKTRDEWYQLYRMADSVDAFYLSSESDIEDSGGLRLYVNQTCYRYPFSGSDHIHTKTYDLLIFSYDPIFSELHYSNTRATPEQIQLLKADLSEINEWLKGISREIIDKDDAELAELIRWGSEDGKNLRERIDEAVLKYNEKADQLFRQINGSS